MHPDLVRLDDLERELADGTFAPLDLDLEAVRVSTSAGYEPPLPDVLEQIRWAEPDPVRAQALLEALARGLATRRPGAAGSLREGLAETFTPTRLGVTGNLRRTLESTNPMESMIEIVRDHSHRVKRWESGEMALRWAPSGMLAAESQFRRVKGFRELPALAAALRRALGLPEEEEAAIA